MYPTAAIKMTVCLVDIFDDDVSQNRCVSNCSSTRTVSSSNLSQHIQTVIVGIQYKILPISIRNAILNKIILTFFAFVQGNLLAQKADHRLLSKIVGKKLLVATISKRRKIHFSCFPGSYFQEI